MPKPTPADPELEQRFHAEFRALAQQPALQLQVTPLQLWAILSTIQLACRHPGFRGPTRRIVEDVARQIQARVAAGGALHTIAEQGWQRRYDK